MSPDPVHLDVFLRGVLRSDLRESVEGARFECDLFALYVCRDTGQNRGSRNEDRFHRSAFADRLESLGGILERILREQGAGVYGTAP